MGGRSSLWSILVGCLLGPALFGFGAPAPLQAATTLKLSTHSSGPATPRADYLVRFAKSVEQRTEGEVTVQIFWANSLVHAKQAIREVRRAYAENRGVDYVASLTPDEAVDRLIIAGTPAECMERIAELFSLAARYGFTQITLGVPLGHDIVEVIDLWSKEILPAVR